MPESRVFKGATRPSMLFGVPLVPLVILCLATLLPFALVVIVQIYLLALMLAVMFVTVFVWMRMLTKQDNWRTKQEIMRMRVRAKKGNASIWGGVSYGPLRLKKRDR